MSDSEDSTVTYIAVSSPFRGLSDIGSPGVDGPPVMPEDPYAYVVATFQAPPSPDYVPGPEEPEQAPLLPEFVLEQVYPEFMPLDEDILLAEEQPLPVAISPTADSPGYIPESDLEDDPEEDDEDPKEDPIDYPADGGDDGDDEDESFDDDEDDDDVDIEEHASSAEETEPFETDETAATPPPHPVARLLAIPTLPPSPLSPWSSPLPQIPSPPLPPILSPLLVSTPLLVSSPPPASPTYPLGYRAAMIRLRVETPSTSCPLPSSAPPTRTPPLLPIPLPTPSLPLLLTSTDCRAGVFEVTLPPQKRLCTAIGLRYEVGESSSAPTARPTGGFRVDYGFVATLDDEIRRDPERYVGYGITDTWEEMLDTDEIYVRLDEAQDDRLLMSGRLNTLFKYRRNHARTDLLIEIVARLSREAWGRSMDASNTARSEVMALRTQVVAQQAEIAGLRAADRTRQEQFIEALRLLKRLQT
ncbi:hypothetical protein Tco_1504039 [Tanacetum coccineum]